MRIGTAAKTAGVSVETVRFYERQGLIGQPSRPIDGGYRSYPSESYICKESPGQEIRRC